MPKAPVFVDTAAFLALANRRDQWHQSVTEVSQQLQDEARALVTTDWVLAEFLASMRDPPNRDRGVQIVATLRDSSAVEIVEANHDQWNEGFELYRNRPDKHWSLIDCISIRLCELRAMHEVLTSDRHFEQAGLEILLR